MWITSIKEGFLEEVKLKWDGEEGRGFGSAEKTGKII